MSQNSNKIHNNLLVNEYSLYWYAHNTTLNSSISTNDLAVSARQYLYYSR